MNCKVCRKTISLLRSLTDQEYCSDAHRAADTHRSAFVLRDLEAAGFETSSTWSAGRKKPNPLWSPEGRSPEGRSPEGRSPEGRSPEGRSREGLWSYTQTALLSLLALSGILLLAIQFAGSTYQGERSESTLSHWLGTTTSSFFGRGANIRPTIPFQQEFSAPSLDRWPSLAGGPNWSIRNGLLQPGGLRIWQETRTLADYRFQFEGSIENSSLSWAVRAIDHRNYQASKMMIRGEKSGPTNELVRFTVIDGKEMPRTRIPIPVQLKAHAFHYYEVRATGNRLVTYVDGKLIDSYIDPRLSSGGVGFFNEARERSSIRWVRLLPGREFVDQLRSYFSFGLDLPFLK